MLLNQNWKNILKLVRIEENPRFSVSSFSDTRDKTSRMRKRSGVFCLRKMLKVTEFFVIIIMKRGGKAYEQKAYGEK